MDIDNKFGNWNDNVSQFLYYDSLKEILNKINIPDKVADYGGANGILKNFIHNAVVIDINKKHNPDIVDNIITHKKEYDLIIIRYVLHYLNDYEVLKLFENIKSYHNGALLIIQFINNNLKDKYYNSVNEFKYFRSEQQLLNLLPDYMTEIYSKEYLVTKEFYKNRLQNKNSKEHLEILKAYYYDYSKTF